MSAQATQLPLRGMVAGLRRFSVPEYHRLAEIGVLTEDDNLELLEGYLVHKMTRNPPHDGTLQRTTRRLTAILPGGWEARSQMAVTLPDSEPEPDLAFVREDPSGYMTRHPGAADVGLLIEVAGSSLDSDRLDKGRIYARAGISIYWIINVPERQVEVYTAPTGPAPAPAYASRVDYRPGQDVPFILGGQLVAQLPVAELLP